MSRGRLELLEPFEPWRGAAHLGRRRGLDGEEHECVVLLGPENTAVDALQLAKAAASGVTELRHPNVPRLLEVCRYLDRIAWVYEEFDGLGLGHVIGADQGPGLSTRAAAEVVAVVAETLQELGPPGWSHPGPEPDDILVEASGHVWIASFTGPFPSAPDRRAPRGEQGEAAVVYRLGVLLAQLVSGVSPGSTTVEDSHAALVRRALIRAMARPGPALDERYGDWLRGMLAWDPDERPPLSAVPAGLRTAGTATGGQSLGDWASAHVTRLRGQVAKLASQRRDGFVRAPADALDPLIGIGRQRGVQSGLSVPPIDATLPPISQLPDPSTAEEPIDDEPTQEESLYAVAEEPLDPLRSSRPRLGPMPVHVGPPPEAVSRRPSLPPGFLEATTRPRVDLPEASEPRVDPPLAPALGRPWKVGAALAVVAVLLAVVNLLLWLRSPAEPAGAEPSLGEVLED